MFNRPRNIAEDLDMLRSDEEPEALEALEEVARAEAITSLNDLMARGKKRGSVTQEEILQLVPQPEDNADRLDEIYAALVKAGIQITDELVDDGEFNIDVSADAEISFDEALGPSEGELEEFEEDLEGEGGGGNGEG